MDWRIPYCAGLIDGEGYVTVANQMQRGRLYPTPVIMVEMTDFDTVIFVSNTFGVGSICQPKKKNLKWQPTLRWTASSRMALQVARLIRPYVIAKRAPVERILAHYGVNFGEAA